MREYLKHAFHRLMGTYLGSDGEELRKHLDRFWDNQPSRVVINTSFGRQVEGRLINYDGHQFNLADVVQRDCQSQVPYEQTHTGYLHPKQLDSTDRSFTVDVRDVRDSYLKREGLAQLVPLRRLRVSLD